MEPSVKLCHDSTEPVLDDPTVYRTFHVNKLCQLASSPKNSHLKASYLVLHFLKGSIGLGLFYSAESNLTFKAYTDAGLGLCADTSVLLLVFAYFLVILSFPGKVGNKMSYLIPLLILSIGQWLLRSKKLSECQLSQRIAGSTN